jgi:hypothetical protein
LICIPGVITVICVGGIRVTYISVIPSAIASVSIRACRIRIPYRVAVISVGTVVIIIIIRWDIYRLIKIIISFILLANDISVINCSSNSKGSVKAYAEVIDR